MYNINRKRANGSEITNMCLCKQVSNMNDEESKDQYMSCDKLREEAVFFVLFCLFFHFVYFVSISIMIHIASMLFDVG